ncbi:MAG: hypothetical protein AUJ34_02060 [Parcubacteria group bacterium CG1_02_41_12]|nr:MAG: hypothetical protein AUJ34_02060 [Parcubacteria group bacterium CG1_02_41_12]PIP67100.1 MAG: hypothetical protein COW93_02005 [Parcubacteria group bacterium CG22_combo_CG10-13_8_21_14_all_41_9]PIQ80381.1 MAG: hypothetical protein COV79_00755 [Parcubacteria group bacterium CG11_big_fil_rev_8_21_14_0_20_41_14]PIR56657.1 MAG: hypothetical protein COU72_05080 [Parcubacteria group bacterium CG10_big_fil_rev_8_21_14_0_10_41_35]
MSPSSPEAGYNPQEEEMNSEEHVESRDPGLRSKEETQQELREKFGMANTGEFRVALKQGNIEQAKAWLAHIAEHQDDFPQYHDTWDSWYMDRKKEITQQELKEKFSMGNTEEFRQALDGGEIEKAKAWLEHIVANKDSFSQYHSTWERWLADRQDDIEAAEIEFS